MSRSCTQQSQRAWSATSVHRARGPAGPPRRRSQSGVVEGLDRPRAARPLLARNAAEGLRRPACPARCRRAGRATPPGSNDARNRVGSPAQRLASIDRAQNPLVLIRWVTTSCTVHPSQRLGCCHSSSRQVGEQAPRAGVAAAPPGGDPATRTSTADDRLCVVARGQEHGGTVARPLRQLRPMPSVLEAAAHQRGPVEEVARVDDVPAGHQVGDLVDVEPAELVPLGEHGEHLGALHRGVRDRRRPRCPRAGPGRTGRSRAPSAPWATRCGDHRQRGRLAQVVGAGLEGEAPHRDALALAPSRRPGRRSWRRRGGAARR